jgi:hypothetical protein
MTRKFTTGTGITAREHAAIETVEDARRSAEAWNRALKEGGFFGAVTQEAVRTCEHILSQADDDEVLEDSPEAFARLIAKCIRVSKAEIGKGNADQAARYAFIAGIEWARATMKWAWEPDAMRGAKVAGGECNAAHQTNERHAALREKRFARMHELAPQVGVDKAAAQCEIEGLGTRAAIKRQWNRQKKRDS